MKPKYVFIVGLPRTGTKLMMNVLENSREKQCQITPENFFLGRFLRPGVRQYIQKIGDLTVDSNVQRLVDDMYSNKFYGTYWNRLANGSLGVDKEIMLRRILASDRSDKAIYSAVLQMNNENPENSILGDRTGPHVYHVPTLMNWFPEAKIVQTLRDPRAVMASEHKKLLHQFKDQIQKSKNAKTKLKPFFLQLIVPVWSLIIILYITSAWIYAARLHHKYKKLYPQNYYLSRFEDLVTEPEKNVKNLCKFLEIEFHEEMLSPPKYDSSFAPKGDTGFDTETLTRWKSYLKPWMQVGLLLCGKKYLKEFGYA